MRVWVVGAAVYGAVVLGGVFALGPGSSPAQTFGDFTVLLAVVFASATCFRAWRRRGPNARAWLFMGLSTALWSFAQAVWTFYGLTLDHHYPFPSLADVGFLLYAIPAAIALFSFQGIRSSGVALLRTILDAGVIASATLFVSWSVVLGPLYREGSQISLTELIELAYPIIDLALASLVLVLAMRSVPGQRRSWLIMGAGLLVLTVTDSVFERLQFDGAPGLSGTPIAFGWVLAFLLIALATVTPQRAGSRRDGRRSTLALEMLPYVPVSAAAVFAFSNIVSDPVLIFSGLIVVVLVFVRQVLIVHENVTFTRDLEQKVAERTVDLSLAREDALESSRLKSEFLATMSHEIRTPMNGVIGLTTLLLDTPLNLTQRQYAEGVQGAGHSLLGLINDILDLSKLEAGKVELDVAPFDPRRLVEEVAGLLSETARGKGLELIAYCRPDVPVSLVGDFGRIRQILANLVSNAVKFTATGEVEISVDFLEAAGDQPHVRFEVRDTGIGIDELDYARLFDWFSQADASTTRRYGGTGLGLAISRRLTQMMGGEIGVTSELGRGSTFWFVLPMPAAGQTLGANSSAHAYASAPVGTTIDSSYAPLAGQRVLVVDDNATNRLVLESQLAGWNMIAESVADGVSALESARAASAAGRPFDIAVLDMCMPGMDGLQLAKAISADESLRSMALMMLTSTPELDKAELAAAGIQQWLMKPVRNSELFDRLILLGAGSGPTPSSAAALRVVQRKVAFPSRGLVLVVEDNEMNQLVAREMVTKLGYRVELATNGAEAVAAVESASYHLVLMDCHMPVMDGFDATAAIRNLAGEASRVPIIAMTAGAQDEDRKRCLDAGMDDYLAKPVDLSALKDTLAHWVPDSIFPHFPTPGGQPDPAKPAMATEPAIELAEPARDVVQLAQRPDEPALDLARLDLLRNLGPADGRGVLAEAAHAFRSEVPASMAALDLAITESDDGALKRAAHKLKGGAANIGAAGAAALCAQLEKLVPADGDGRGRELIGRLETELAKVDAALDRALGASP